MKMDQNVTIMRKILETQKDCGVKHRSKSESDERILERIMQLQLEGKCETKEYHFLTAIRDRSNL